MDDHPEDTPTDARPGSDDKIRVLRSRAARREPLFHPGDRTDHPVTPAGERGPGSRPRGRGSIDASGKQWMARVSIGGVRVYLGLHATREDAELAIRDYLGTTEEGM